MARVCAYSIVETTRPESYDKISLFDEPKPLKGSEDAGTKRTGWNVVAYEKGRSPPALRLRGVYRGDQIWFEAGFVIK